MQQCGNTEVCDRTLLRGKVIF